MKSGIIAKPLVIGLRIVGLWPKVGVPYYFLFFNVIALFTLIFQYWDIAFKHENIVIVMDHLGATIAETLFFIKFFIILIKRRTVQKLLMKILKEWDKVERDIIKQIIAKKYDLANLYSFCVFGIYLSTDLLFLIAAFTKNSTLESIEDRQFIVQLTYPFESKKSPNFEILFFLQFINMIVASGGNAILDGLFILLVLHAGAKFDIIKEEIIEFSEVTKERDEQTILKMCKKIVNSYQDALNYCQMLEDIYSLQILVQVLGSILGICCNGYMFSKMVKFKLSTYSIFKFLLFFASDLSEIAVYCFGGEYLCTKNESIGFVVYNNSSWFEMQTRDSKALMLILLRSQKSLNITAGKLMQMTHRTFTSICQASFSYISVLRALG